MKKGLKVFLLSLFVFALVLGISGCTRDQENTPNPPPEETVPPENGGNGTGTEAPNTEAKTDEELTQKLEAEEKVTGGRIYEQGDTVIATMMIETGVAQSDIETLAQAYGQEIKDKYPDKKVNVQAVQDGNNVVDLTLD